MSEQIVIALISLAGVLSGTGATALVAWWRISLSRKRAELAECEMEFQRDGLSFAAFLADWHDTAQELSQLIAETEVDRILILKAWNGSLDPKWTTAVYQMREIGQEPRQYVHFELDSDYVDRLRHIVANQSLYFDVASIPDSFIKSVYTAEGVTGSYWSHISSRKLPKADAVSISYVSFSTHAEGGMSHETQTRCMIMAGRLKGIAANFEIDN